MKARAQQILEQVKPENKERVMFYLDAALQARLKRVCAERRVRMSSVIEKLIEAFLNDLGDEAPKGKGAG